MWGLLKRIAAASRAKFGPAAGVTRDDARPEASSGPALRNIAGEPERGSVVIRAVTTSQPPLKVTISKPEPVAKTEAELERAVRIKTTDVVARPAPNINKRTVAPHRSQRPKLSPIAVKKAAGRSMFSTPRPAKTATRTPVRGNRVSEDSVRMQAALMRMQRQRDASRALERMKALLPTATILTLKRAA